VNIYIKISTGAKNFRSWNRFVN